MVNRKGSCRNCKNSECNGILSQDECPHNAAKLNQYLMPMVQPARLLNLQNVELSQLGLIL